MISEKEDDMKALASETLAAIYDISVLPLRHEI
jgi:hypothetical protein